MRKRDIFKIFCFVVYIALVVLFFVYSELGNKNVEEEPCPKSECLRLCRSETFDVLQETMDSYENYTKLYTILTGIPCGKMRMLENDQWKFSENESISVNETSFSENKYCLELKDENATEAEDRWSLLVCDDNSEIFMLLSVILSITAIAILSLVLLIYCFVNELKNLHGKCIIGFLVSLLLACIYSRVWFIDSTLFELLINLSLIFAVLWITVLIFDVWWTLSFFDSTSGGKLKFYVYYVVGCAAVALICSLIFMKLYWLSYVFLCIYIVVCLFCFIFATMKIYEMTGVEIDFGHKRFHHEEQRFLLYLQLFTLIIVTWTVEFFSRNFIETYESQAIADILFCIQAIFIFIVLVLKRNVREVIIRSVCCC